MNFVAGQQPAFDPPSLLATITNMGMTCNDPDGAYRLLERLSYHHLKYGYLVAFRTPSTGSAWSIDSSYDFSDLIALYEFDSKLKRLCNEVAETFELRLRNYVAQEIGGGQAGGLGYEAIGAYLNLDTSEKNNKFKSWKGRIPQSLKDSLEGKIISSVRALAHEGAVTLSPEQVPLWAITEVIELGKLETLFGLMADTEQKRIALRFGINDVDFFSAVISLIRRTRNFGAHYSPLWCQTFDQKLGNNTIGLADCFGSGYSALLLQIFMGGERGIYGILSVLSFISRSASGGNDWRDRMKEHLESFNLLNLPFRLESLGFSDPDWQDSSQWKDGGWVSIPKEFKP